MIDKDIVERLRRDADWLDDQNMIDGSDSREAADEIERLRAENEEMKYIIELGSMTAEQIKVHLRDEYGYTP